MWPWMVNQNGTMKSQEEYLNMIAAFYSDVISALVTEKEVRKDLETIRNRVSTEGLSFLTKTLPSLGKAVDRALANGTQLDIPSFRKVRGTRLPQFMRRLLELLFSIDGYPLLDASHQKGDSAPYPGERRETPPVVSSSGWEASADRQSDALRAIRQVSNWFYKLEIPSTDQQNERVINDFKQTEEEIWDSTSLTSPQQKVLAIARTLCHRVLNMGDPFTGLPKHGPGAVATGERSSEKHCFSRWYSVLTDVFTFDHWFSANAGAVCDSLSTLQNLPDLKTGTAKVVLVPKDSRGPRLISCEPLEYQWVQQAILSVFTETVESHPYTRGKVNFTSQEINRNLALEASRTGKYATLDMKEASDRVSIYHVAELFPDRWCEALFASRSTHTRLPDGTLVHLKKMAPMGSAVCFPTEAIVFWSLSVAGIAHTFNVSVADAMKDVYVYGDDIIVRSEHHAVVQSTLESFGLKVNKQKCCTAGFFKESCGMDAFKGKPVTPIRLKSPWNQIRSPGGLASWVAHSNNLWASGYWRTAQCVERLIEKAWGKNIPTFPSDAGCICYVRPELPIQVPSSIKKRFNPLLHRYEVKGLRIISAEEKSRTEGYPLLLRALVDLERRNGPAAPPEESRKDKSGLPMVAGSRQAGIYPIAHRNKLSRAWTPCPV